MAFYSKPGRYIFYPLYYSLCLIEDHLAATMKHIFILKKYSKYEKLITPLVNLRITKFPIW